MKKLLIACFLLSMALQGKSQKIPAYTAADVIQSASSGDTVYVINFWATWCMPCVQELPEFNILYDRIAGKPVKILMVSLDFKDSYPEKLAMFIRRQNLKPPVAWLIDNDPNAYIPKIDEKWEGSIPATLIIQPGRQRKFVEGQVSANQISKVIDNMLAE